MKAVLFVIKPDCINVYHSKSIPCWNFFEIKKFGTILSSVMKIKLAYYNASHIFIMFT